MKSYKLIAASLLVVASITSAFADVNIKVTGSTAFRKAFYFSAVNAISSPKIAAIGGKTDGSDMSGANRAVITGVGKAGTAYAGQNVSIQCAFAGSIGGLTALVTPSSTIPASGFASTATWLSASNAAGSAASVANSGTGKVTGYVDLGSGGAAAFDPAAVPTVSMSDSFFSSTPLSGTVTEENPAGNGIGVVAFDWVKGQNGVGTSAAANYAGFTNMTALQANLLLAVGELPLSFFTGVASDAGVDVLFVGRNNDSGTRLDTEAEADFGYGFSTENQYQPTIVGGVITGVTNIGDAGYPSGGSVAAALDTVQASGAKDDVNHPFIFASYLGKSDSATVVGLNANAILSFNGVKYAQADDAIRYGAYSGWSYEHAYYTATGGNKSLIDDVSKQARLTDAVQSGVILTTMKVSRQIEGGVISP